ncbi:MAG: ABC transporter permease [Chloroflexi bacterium]|nr:ABC transporter permease [Chloroflexota bacterium]
MRKILAIAWNDIVIEFSDRATLIFFLVLPVIFTAVVGVGLRSAYTAPDPNADNRYPVPVVDEDRSALSAQFVELLSNSAVMRPVAYEREEAARVYEEDNLAGLLVIPSGFGERLLAGEAADLALRQPSNDTRALAVGEAISAAGSRLSTAALIAQSSVAEAERLRPFADAAARAAYFQQGYQMALEFLEQPPATVEVTRSAQAQVVTDLGSSMDQASAGQLVTWVLITLVGAAELFVNERLGGTLRRLLVTPTRKATVLTGKIGGRLAMGLVQMLLLVVIGATVFGVNWGRSVPALAIMLLAFGLAAVALGTLVGTIAKTRGQASGLTTMISMVGAALGGAWWPLEITPPAYQTAVKALPTTWAMTGLKDVIVAGQGVSGILPEAGILLGFAALFLALGIWRFRYE